MGISKLRRVFFFIGVLFVLGWRAYTGAYAQTDGGVQIGGTPEPPVSLEEAIGDSVGFNLLGFTGRTLQPQASIGQIFLNIPAHWQLTEGAQVELDIITFLGREDIATEGIFGGWLVVEFNGVILDAVLLNQNGAQTLTFSIPPAALVSPSGQYLLQIDLEGIFSCNLDERTNTIVIVQPSSRFILPHQVIAPVTDLTRLPRPIEQRSFLPDRAILVVPDEPTTAELQAALTVAAGFGRMTSRLALSLLPVGRLTTELRDSNHLIMVGKLTSFPFLSEASLSPPGDVVMGAAEDDGFIQMVVSPWNHIKVALVVGGNTDVAVVKAAQAVSSTVIRTGNRLDAALVEDVNTLDTLSGFLATDRTLADLGYGVEILDGSGLSRFDLEFNVPPGQTVVAEEEAALNLIFNHSSLLDYTRSGLVLRVNNEPVGSVRLSDVSTSLVSQQIVIPRTAIHAGVNQLTLLAELSPLAECDTLGRDSLWLNIQPESSLHLPLGPAQDAVVGAVTLDGYPEPFTFDQTLSTTAFVLPANDPVAWDVAAKLAFDLGKYVNGVVLDVIVAYGHDVPEAVRQGRDLLIVGRPTTLPILAEINDRLPAPFTPGSDRVVDERLAVAYRIAPEIGLGYVEFLPAPWDSNRTVIAVLGTAEGGLRAAATALLTPEQRRKFAGDFVVVQGSQVFTPAVLTAAGAAEGSEAAVDGQGDQVVSEGTREAMATPVATAVVSHTAAADEARTASNMANSSPTPTAEVSFNLGGLTVNRPVAEAEPANNNAPVETVERVNPLNLALWASVGIGVLLLLFLGVGIARQR